MCSKEPLVSVVVPAYNAAESVIKCLDSVYAQTYTRIETIVVNDGSTDHTPRILADYGAAHDGMTVINQSNRGLSAARNAGLEVAKGEFLFFLDSDDYVGPGEIESLMGGISGDDIDMVVGGMTYVDGCGAVLRTVCDPACMLDERSYWDRVYSNENGNSVQYVVSCGKLYRSDLFKNERFDVGKIHEDEFIIHRIVSQCHKICVVASDELFYVQNGESISHNPSARSRLDVAEAFLKRNLYFLDMGYIDLFWRSLCQSKTAIIAAKSAAVEAGEMPRWRALCRDWRGHFLLGRDNLDFKSHDCLAGVAYFCVPFLFR